jgi:hypothetical protein
VNDRRLRQTFDLDLPWALEQPKANGRDYQQKLDDPDDNTDGTPRMELRREVIGRCCDSDSGGRKPGLAAALRGQLRGQAYGVREAIRSEE